VEAAAGVGRRERRDARAALDRRSRADRPPRWRELATNISLRVASVIFFFLLWYYATTLDWVSPLVFPSPVTVGQQAHQFLASGNLWASVLASSRRVIMGFMLAAVVGIPLGVLLGVCSPAKAFLDPIISLIRPLPSLTWIPLTMLWFGIGEEQKYAIVFMGSVIYVLLYTFESTRAVDPVLIKAARNLGASDFAIMREVILPGSLAGVIAGLKVTLAISWTCVLSAEMVAANQGLGALIWYAHDWDNIALVLVGMVSISLTVLVIDSIVALIEPRLIPWERHRHTR
jgi:taurine transport system permease protein